LEDAEQIEKPYELLSYITREVMDNLPIGKGQADDTPATPELVTDRIRIMYYSALVNLYVQRDLPVEIKAIGGDMPPRLEVTLKRSYADFTTAADWLSKYGGRFVDSSPAKQLYEEVSNIKKELVTGDASAFLNA
jgi:hypothetical protein